MTRLTSSLLALTVCAATILSVRPASAQVCGDPKSCAAQAGGDPSQAWARTALDKSPRHREYVTIEHDGRKVNTFVVYPEASAKTPVVILIHEIFGVSSWMKLQADELAAKGYIVVVPDLISGIGPDGGGTDALFMSTGTNDPVTKAVTTLDAAQVTADLDAVADYGKKLPSSNGKLAIAGFCWGGGKSFLFATHRTDLSGVYSFYGPPPPVAAMASINAPIYGFYGGMDARIGAMIPQAVIDMKAAGKFYEPVTYEGAGHGFMRAGQDPNAKPADKKAFDEGFARMLKELKANTSATKKTAYATPVHKPAAKTVAANAVQCHDMGAME